MGRIRSKAVCVFYHAGRYLLVEGYDPVKKQHFFVPLGGGIEFGETSAAAAKREVQEEIGAEAVDMNLLGISENIFEYNGKPGHEIVFVYQARFADETLYHHEVLQGMETNGMPIVARWIEHERIHNRQVIVYPEGISAMLKC